MKRLLRGVALTMAVGVLALGTDAQAGKRHRGSLGSCGSSGGSHGSHGSSGGSWGSHGSSGGSNGSSGGSHGSYGSSGGSSGSHGSHRSSGGRRKSHGSYGSHGSSGGSYGSTGSSGVVHVQPVHVTAVAAPQANSSTVVAISNTTHAFLVVQVPADATVFLVGQRMSMTGANRVFQIPTSVAGKEYSYPIAVEVTRDGETRRIEHTERLVSGRTHTVRVNENTEQRLVAVAAR